MLKDAARKELLRIARASVESYVCEGARLAFEVEDTDLLQPRGAFVTLKKKGMLRGCIGYPEPIKPLYEAVADAACCAATEDPRFSPVEPAELSDIEIDVSVLSQPELAESVDEIVVGTHGLIVRRHSRSGLLLPQVATEYGLDREQFLSHTCLKAGLPSDAWQQGASIYRFTAEVFGEGDGPVHERKG